MRTPGVFLIMLAVLSMTADAGQIHRWEDAQGRVHYSNKPRQASGGDADSAHDWVNARGNKTYSDRSRKQIQQDKQRLLREMECMRDLTEIIEEPAARPRVRVVLLTARWCDLSRQARSYLQQTGIKFVEYDIDRNRLGRSLYASLAKKGIPVLLVGKSQMFGFRTDLADKLLRQQGGRK